MKVGCVRVGLLLMSLMFLWWGFCLCILLIVFSCF